MSLTNRCETLVWAKHDTGEVKRTKVIDDDLNDFMRGGIKIKTMSDGVHEGCQKIPNVLK